MIPKLATYLSLPLTKALKWQLNGSIMAWVLVILSWDLSKTCWAFSATGHSVESSGRGVRKVETHTGFVYRKIDIEMDLRCEVAVAVDVTIGFEQLRVEINDQGIVFLLCLEAINLFRTSF